MAPDLSVARLPSNQMSWKFLLNNMDFKIEKTICLVEIIVPTAA